MVGFAGAAIVGIDVYICSEVLGGGERARVNGLEGEVGAGFYCWLRGVSE